MNRILVHPFFVKISFRPLEITFNITLGISSNLWFLEIYLQLMEDKAKHKTLSRSDTSHVTQVFLHHASESDGLPCDVGFPPASYCFSQVEHHL